jgi:hypothetical protein
MRKLLAAMSLAGVLAAGCGGYSDEFRQGFMAECLASSGGQRQYCECVLDHLETHGPSNEKELTSQDQTRAIEACRGEIAG